MFKYPAVATAIAQEQLFPPSVSGLEIKKADYARRALDRLRNKEATVAVGGEDPDDLAHLSADEILEKYLAAREKYGKRYDELQKGDDKRYSRAKAAIMAKNALIRATSFGGGYTEVLPSRENYFDMTNHISREDFIQHKLEANDNALWMKQSENPDSKIADIRNGALAAEEAPQTSKPWQQAITDSLLPYYLLADRQRREREVEEQRQQQQRANTGRTVPDSAHEEGDNVVEV